MFRRLWFIKLCATALCGSAVTLSACATLKKTTSGIPAVANTSDEETLIDDGDSAQPSFSPSGTKLVYVSGKRANHALPQVYERDLESGDERRLTFQNGTTFGPRYHPKESWIVYSSTTDELKENPPLLYPTTGTSKLPPHYQEPAEVYIHSLDGLEITRVTDRAGFDGDPRFSADGKQLVWTRALKDKLQMVIFNVSTKALTVKSGLGMNPANWITSPDRNSSAWIDWDDAFGISKLKFITGKDPQREINAEHIVTKADLIFSPDNKFLAWSQYNAIGQHFEIWVYNLETKCPHMMVGSDAADRRHPAFAPDMKRLAYTLTRGERSRIVTLPFVPPTGPCSAIE